MNDIINLVVIVYCIPFGSVPSVPFCRTHLYFYYYHKPFAYSYELCYFGTREKKRGVIDVDDKYFDIKSTVRA